MAALPNSNISTSLVANTLQTSSHDVGTLCTHLDDYDITDATILIGDIESTYLNDTVLVTEEVIDDSGW